MTGHSEVVPVLPNRFRQTHNRNVREEVKLLHFVLWILLAAHISV